MISCHWPVSLTSRLLILPTLIKIYIIITLSLFVKIAIEILRIIVITESLVGIT